MRKHLFRFTTNEYANDYSANFKVIEIKASNCYEAIQSLEKLGYNLAQDIIGCEFKEVYHSHGWTYEIERHFIKPYHIVSKVKYNKTQRWEKSFRHLFYPNTYGYRDGLWHQVV